MDQMHWLITHGEDFRLVLPPMMLGNDLPATLSDHSYTGTTTSPPKKIQNLCSQHSFPESVLTHSFQSEKYLNELQGCTLQMQLA